MIHACSLASCPLTPLQRSIQREHRKTQVIAVEIFEGGERLLGGCLVHKNFEKQFCSVFKIALYVVRVLDLESRPGGNWPDEPRCRFRRLFHAWRDEHIVELAAILLRFILEIMVAYPITVQNTRYE